MPLLVQEEARPVGLGDVRAPVAASTMSRQLIRQQDSRFWLVTTAVLYVEASTVY